MMIVILGDIFKAYYNLQKTPIQTIWNVKYMLQFHEHLKVI